MYTILCIFYNAENKLLYRVEKNEHFKKELIFKVNVKTVII